MGLLNASRSWVVERQHVPFSKRLLVMSLASLLVLRPRVTIAYITALLVLLKQLLLSFYRRVRVLRSKYRLQCVLEAHSTRDELMEHLPILLDCFLDNIILTALSFAHLGQFAFKLCRVSAL